MNKLTSLRLLNLTLFIYLFFFFGQICAIESISIFQMCTSCKSVKLHSSSHQPDIYHLHGHDVSVNIYIDFIAKRITIFAYLYTMYVVIQSK